MKIPEEHLDKYIALRKQKAGVELDRQTAYDEAIQLMRTIELVESNSQGHPSTVDSLDSSGAK